MTIAQLLADQSLKEVESGGLFWRVKRIKSKDLMRAGIATLVHLAPDDLMSASTSSEEEMRASLEASYTSKLAKLTDVQQARLYDSLDAVVCAGVVEVSSDEGQSWEKIRFTMKEKDHAPGKGVLLVETLPNVVRQELANAIQGHSRKDEEDADALATFRKRA